MKGKTTSALAVAAGLAISGGAIDYGQYAAVLSQFVDDNGLVNYEGLKENPEHLDAFTGQLADLDRTTYEACTTNQKIAFWINAYNGLTLKLIVGHYPIESSVLRSVVYPKNSIMQIPGRWTKVTFEVMGKPMTLDGIEDGVLRAQFDEPRIHMALVCSALSCPPLRREPYTGQKLDEQLDDQARKFLANRNRFRIDRDSRMVYLSSIFKWFGEDFVARYGRGGPPGLHGEKTRAVINFITRYVSDSDAKFLSSGDYEIKYLDYDWTLNEQPTSSPTSGR
jgi:hypothetical protein